METSSANPKPFVVRRNINKTLIPVDSPAFDEGVERIVHFVQGENAFIIIQFFELYESLRTFYLHFAFQNECNAYAGLLLALGILNLIWIIISFFGMKAINAKRSFLVKRFMLAVIFIFVARLAFYIVMGIDMNNAINSQQEEQSASTTLLCNALYQGGLIFITAIMEGIALVILLLLTFKVKNYIMNWESSQFASSGGPGNYVRVIET